MQKTHSQHFSYSTFEITLKAVLLAHITGDKVIKIVIGRKSVLFKVSAAINAKTVPKA